VHEVKSVRHCLAILRCFTPETPEIGVIETSHKLNLSKSTVSRLLSTLKQENWVVKISSSQKYRLAPRVLELANIFLANFEWRMIAIPHLKDLRDKTDETVTVFVIQENQRVCIEKFESSHELRPVLNIGGHYPLHAGAAGKVLFAFLSKEKRKEIVSKYGLPRLTENTITDFMSLEKELSRIRKEGYAVSYQERAQFVSSVSAPIKDFNGEVIASLNLSGPLIRFTQEKVKEFILLTMLTADKISQEIGYKKS
jgi:IclR family KDG regulon transcriptional repressor